MATKSIYKNVNIKGRDLTVGLVNALENAKNKKSKEVTITKSFQELKGDDLRKYFGEQ